MEQVRTFTKEEIKKLMDGYEVYRDHPFMKKGESKNGINHVIVKDDDGNTYPMNLYSLFTWSNVDGYSEIIINIDTDDPLKPRRR